MNSKEKKKKLKFASGPSFTLLIAYLEGKLAATVRFEDEKDISEGDNLEVISTEVGKRLGEAEVKETKKVPIKDVIGFISEKDALYSIETTESLISVLNEFYDKPMNLLTEVKVIILNPELYPK